MFIGKYEIEDKVYNNIYYKNKYGYALWNENTFSPLTQNIETLDFTISGKSYEERKNNVEELAKDWQYNFSSLNWSYSELVVIQNKLYELGKRYGLLRDFKENCIC